MNETNTQFSALAQLICTACKQGRLPARAELIQYLQVRQVGSEASAPTFEQLEQELDKTLTDNPEFALVLGPDGEKFYRHVGLMSATYAEILAGKKAPCLLIAKTVRKNSQEYPRPIALDIFEYPPFDLDTQSIQACLQSMAMNTDFDDISFVESSAGTVYLYSRMYLEHNYAAFLAERYDVDLSLNP